MSSRAPIFGLLAVLLLGVAFFFLLYQPADKELDEVRAETAGLEAERSTLSNELDRLREIEEREVEFRAGLARLEEYIPSGIAQSALIRQLQLAADQSGVEIVTVAFSDPQPVLDAPPTGVEQTVLANIPVSVSVDGGYFQMVDFMRRVEVDVTRAVLVENLAVVEGEDDFPQLSTTFGGQLFAVVPDTSLSVQPQPGEDAAGEGTTGEGTTDDGLPGNDSLDDPFDDAGDV